MIDYNTILSTTEDKMTLLQWLKKVEAALKDASATTFKVNKKGNATLTFSIEFADGSELESGEIVLQQGESVESAAIVNGHLILTLTNGDELDAGNLGAVTSFEVNASQHLIVHYQDGTFADLGSVAVGFENIEDASGHKRFIEGDIDLLDVDGITKNYGKWSLSGTHLMLVVAGTIAPNKTIPFTNIAFVTLPSWIFNKIVPTASDIVLRESELIYNLASTITTTRTFILTKRTSNQVGIVFDGFTSDSDSYGFRCQLDLLIDNE